MSIYETVCHIEPPCCPVCLSRIHSCYRYGDLTKSFYEDLTCVKEKVCDRNYQILNQLRCKKLLSLLHKNVSTRNKEEENAEQAETPWMSYYKKMTQYADKLVADPLSFSISSLE